MDEEVAVFDAYHDLWEGVYVVRVSIGRKPNAVSLGSRTTCKSKLFQGWFSPSCGVRLGSGSLF